MRNTQNQSDPSSATESPEPQLFSSRSHEPDSPRRSLVLGAAIAALVMLLIGLAVFLERGRHGPAAEPLNALRPEDPYARNLEITQLQMSQSTSLSGGTSTFIDGRVHNGGVDTLTGATMQVVFRNDVDLAPLVQVLPLSLIRMREPYIDTEPVSAAPLVPGADADFRLIFETIPPNWNQQMPEIKFIGVAKK